MSDSFKKCPICKTSNHPNALVCTTCGTSLSDTEPSNRATKPIRPPDFDFRFGENDLLETSVNKNATMGLLVIVGILVGIVGTLAVVLFLNQRNNASDNTSPQILVSETARPTLALVTVTQGPPTSTATNTPLPTFTPSETPTKAPCMQRIVAGGSLIGAITNCGYTSLDIMPTVMALNNILDPASISEGQEIIIPWPSPTFDPNAPTSEPGAQRNLNTVSNGLDLNSEIVAFAPTPTATLPPGVMWYEITPGDNVITIAVAFNANAKTLSELNPEIDFAKCEFGERFGGPECLVQLSAGQLMRVPAPTATPTLSPTADPNSTATPTATPTYNEPSVVSPPDKQFFGANELISLRWIPSATLQAGEAYRIDVTDITSGQTYTAITSDIFFLVPTEWQGKDSARHEYTWTVGVIQQSNPETITFPTEIHTFVWQGLTENSQ